MTSPLNNVADLFEITIHSLSNDDVPSSTTLPIPQCLSQGFDSNQLGTARLRWLHVPANNLQWVQGIMEKWYHNRAGLDDSFWSLKVRPAPSQVKFQPPHSRHMEPSCFVDADKSRNHNAQSNVDHHRSHGRAAESGDRPLLHLYIPYMNWELYQDFCTRTYAISSLHDLSERQKKEKYLNECIRNGIKVHPRRSLDQFYYSSLLDTSARDADQTISKWTGTGLPKEGRSRASHDALMILVDQLWCWVLDDNTVISFFPSHDLQYQHTEFTELYQSVLAQWAESKTVWDLYSLLVGEATTFIFHQKNKSFTDLIETYRWVIKRKVASQTRCFQKFHDYNSSGNLDSILLDDRKELKLVLEVADIADELKMIRHVIDKQREVVKSLIATLCTLHPATDDPRPSAITHVYVGESLILHGNSSLTIQQSAPTMSETVKMLAQGIKRPAGDTLVATDEDLDFIGAEVDAIRNEANTTHQALLSLLDLKQKAAALMEARATSQQGRVIMLFTIVTIIFLPLSFFTSYFGQNVSDITGDEGNPTSIELWRYGAPISIVVILAALLVACYIAKLNLRRRFRKALIKRMQPFNIEELLDNEV
ncbi:hypothetical protein GGR58DRAFT_468607 [Xylaria digitata]|nr:hypothetical protein GGR58DRAFT_468607 [Xylaria digitata]